MKQMIPVPQAKELIAANTRTIQPERIPLQQCQGLVLARDLVAPYDIPAYPQSSMDGYALAFESLGGEILIDGEMAAGSSSRQELERGRAVRIFTGAAVPQGADTVLVQEKARPENGMLVIEDDKLRKGDNVRPVGSEIGRGELAMGRGDLLTPAAIGFLAGMGFNEAEAFPPPKTTIIVTGNELQQPGQPLGYGQVFESNSLTLLSALDQLHVRNVQVHRAKDDPGQLESILAKALQDSDLVLMTGGVSVGEYDFTLHAFEACGVEKIFHKIRQKPGKPILFGSKEGKPVFGLPGNPASVLTCFFEYVLPAIGFLMNKEHRLRSVRATLMTPYQKTAGLTHFLKALITGSEVRLLTGQESYKLNSFAKANCLAVIPEELTFMNTGDEVEVHILPNQNP